MPKKTAQVKEQRFLVKIVQLSNNIDPKHLVQETGEGCIVGNV